LWLAQKLQLFEKNSLNFILHFSTSAHFYYLIIWPKWSIKYNFDNCFYLIDHFGHYICYKILLENSKKEVNFRQATARQISCSQSLQHCGRQYQLGATLTLTEKLISIWDLGYPNHTLAWVNF
jgi:hypothetical protein